jgi:hypothetical protein
MVTNTFISILSSVSNNLGRKIASFPKSINKISRRKNEEFLTITNLFDSTSVVDPDPIAS